MIQQEQLPWIKGAYGSDSGEAKTLVDRGCGRLLVEALRFEPGGTVAAKALAKMHSALVVTGGAEIDGVQLGEWDFMQVMDAGHGAVKFPQGATLLALTLR